MKLKALKPVYCIYIWTFDNYSKEHQKLICRYCQEYCFFYGLYCFMARRSGKKTLRPNNWIVIKRKIFSNLFAIFIIEYSCCTLINKVVGLTCHSDRLEILIFFDFNFGQKIKNSLRSLLGQRAYLIKMGNKLLFSGRMFHVFSKYNKFLRPYYYTTDIGNMLL